MDGIHDLGGKLGFGPVAIDHDDGPPFHEPWEGRMLGIVRAISQPPDWNVDKFRHTVELEEPVHYLTKSYFDRWYKAQACMLIGSGLASVEELVAGKSDGTKVTGLRPPMSVDVVAKLKRRATNFERPHDDLPRFRIGDDIVVRNLNPTGHSRLPAYARGRAGAITAYHGAHVFPDASARGESRAEPLYTVRFGLGELFPEAEGLSDRVHLDLWESYLDPDR